MTWDGESKDEIKRFKRKIYMKLQFAAAISSVATLSI